MPLVFNDTDTENGFCQEIDSICDTDSTSYSLPKKARRLNNALDQYFGQSMRYCGNWSVGDSNATDLPSATTNIVSGQADYGISLDMLVIDSVWIKDSSGTWKELQPYAKDVSTTNTGTPTTYSKNERSIIFNVIPNYDSTAGIEVFYRRTFARFVSTDTTKTAGIPSIHDFYLARLAALPYLIEKGLPQKNDVQTLITNDEGLIKSYYSLRERDVKRRLEVNYSGCNSNK